MGTVTVTIPGLARFYVATIGNNPGNQSKEKADIRQEQVQRAKSKLDDKTKQSNKRQTERKNILKLYMEMDVPLSLSSSISSFDMVGLSISLLKSSFPSPFSTSHLLFSSVALPPAIYLRFGFFEMGRLFPFLAVHVLPIPSLTGTLYFSFFSNALSSTTPPRTLIHSYRAPYRASYRALRIHRVHTDNNPP